MKKKLFQITFQQFIYVVLVVIDSEEVIQISNGITVSILSQVDNGIIVLSFHPRHHTSDGEGGDLEPFSGRSENYC